MAIKTTPFLVLVCLISNGTNATAIIGGLALNMHTRTFVTEYEQALTAVNRRVEASEKTLAAIRAEAHALRTDVEGEIAEGRLSGYTGRGVVTDKLDKMVVEAERASVAMAELRDTTSAVFSELQSYSEAGHGDPVFIKERSERIRQAVIQMDEQSPTAVLAAMLPTSRAAIAFPEATGRSSGLRAKQAEALEQSIKPRVEQTLAALENLAAETAGVTIDLPRYDHLTAPEAGMRYAGQYPIYRGMAMAIDLMPLIFLVLLTITARRSDPVLDLIIAELRQALLAIAELNKVSEQEVNVTVLPLRLKKGVHNG